MSTVVHDGGSYMRSKNYPVLIFPKLLRSPSVCMMFVLRVVFFGHVYTSRYWYAIFSRLRS